MAVVLAPSTCQACQDVLSQARSEIKNTIHKSEHFSDSVM